ncbi:uncharacterized protein ARMOST_11668 [Armillaria ostoyae]|uniref:Reverse transcriptase RNase H-like domain-containing protein n=1 Tax=Armillaria ostoyae TaxID=47428 RepID=A0A284RHS7_ARMOS|nr:uncharacterized protein ARMOST_11668 [Armillaria ostoyae]
MPIPKLYTSLPTRLPAMEYKQEWAPTFEDTEVWAEQGPKTQYSMMEREALAAKEGLVRFQPFIEGERITLITDHSALQWAKTYENSNRQLASWGMVFSAYTPLLEIVHCPGCKHLNIDPLSCLPRPPPSHISPNNAGKSPLRSNSDLAESQEATQRNLPALRAMQLSEVHNALNINRSENAVDGKKEMRNEPRRLKRGVRTPGRKGDESQVPDDNPELAWNNALALLWAAANGPLLSMHMTIEDDRLLQFTEGYQQDKQFHTIWKEVVEARDSCSEGGKFFVDQDHLLFFTDADSQA